MWVRGHPTVPKTVGWWSKKTPASSAATDRSLVYIYILFIWWFLKIGVLANRWFIMQKPIQVDDLGVTLFQETTICYYRIYRFYRYIQHEPSANHTPIRAGGPPRSVSWVEITRLIKSCNGYVVYVYMLRWRKINQQRFPWGAAHCVYIIHIT